MRTIYDSELALLKRRRRQVSYALTVRTPDGVQHRLDNKFGREWVKSLRITEDIDQPSMSLDVELQREWESYSLSPLVYHSRFNTAPLGVNEFGGSNQPMLELDNRIYVWVNLTPEDNFTESWMLIFSGRIISVDPSGSTIKLVARDAGHDLVTTWIETASQTLGTVEGQPVEQLIGQLLSSWKITTPLFTPVSPNWLVKQFKQERMPLYEALSNIVMQFGWDLRYRYTVGNLINLTLYEPDREKNTADFSFGPDDYYDLSGMATTLDGVRNRIHLTYGPSGARATVSVESAGSLSKYRIPRVMWIEESSNSPLSLESEASRMALACLKDLAFPKFAMQATMPLFPWAQLGDVYTFTGNDLVFDQSKDFSVAGYTHDIKGGKATTTLRLRDGKPSGAYGRWLQREFRRGVKFL